MSRRRRYGVAGRTKANNRRPRASPLTLKKCKINHARVQSFRYATEVNKEHQTRERPILGYLYDSHLMSRLSAAETSGHLNFRGVSTGSWFGGCQYRYKSHWVDGKAYIVRPDPSGKAVRTHTDEPRPAAEQQHALVQHLDHCIAWRTEEGGASNAKAVAELRDIQRYIVSRPQPLIEAIFHEEVVFYFHARTLIADGWEELAQQLGTSTQQAIARALKIGRQNLAQ